MPEDPYAKFGGSVVAEDPYAKFGGSIASAPPVLGMELLGGTPPPAPKPPLPTAPGVMGVKSLDQTPDAPRRNPRTGQMMQQGPLPGPFGLVDAPTSGVNQMSEGASQVADANAKGTTPGRQIAGGASKIIRGGMQVAAPLLPAAAVAAPAAVATGLATGTVTQAGTKAGLDAAGVAPEYSDLASDVAGIAAGGAGAKYGPRMLRGAGNRIAPQLQNAAETQYNQVLGPTTKANKALASRVTGGYDAPAPELGPNKTVPVPGLVDRGVTAMTRKGLGKKINAAVSAAGDELESAWNDLPSDAVVPAARVYSAIEKNLSVEFTRTAPDGQSAPTGPDGARGLDFGRSLVDYLKSHEVTQPDGTKGLKYDSLRQFRQDWDDLVEKANGFGNDLTGKVTAAAYKAASDGLRNIINGDNPNIAAINREFSFWKQAADVMNATLDRTTGQAKPLGRKMARVMGQGVGFGHGGPAGAVLGGEVMDAVEGVITSPGWKTVSAVVKNRLASAITSQDPKAIAAAVSTAQQALPKQPLKDLIHKYTDNDVQDATPAGPEWWSNAPTTDVEAHANRGQSLRGVFDRSQDQPRTNYEDFWNRQPPTQAETTQRYKELFDEARARETQKAPLGDVLNRFHAGTVETPEGVHRAGPEWWENQPDYDGMFQQAEAQRPTPKPTVQSEMKRGGVPSTETPEGVHRGGTQWWNDQPDYAALFDQADKIAARRARTKPSVPETGIPENVARVVDARERMAKSLTGKGWNEATATERNVINQMVSEGHGMSVQPIPRFAKGGTIRRPTLLSDLKTGKPTGIMAEAGPEAIVPLGNPDEPTAAKSTVPERPDTMRLQLDQLTQGARRVVMFPHGTPMLKRPKGMQAYQDAHGNSFIFDPSAISTDQIDSAIEKDDLPSILGAADGGMGAPDKSALNPPVEAVVGRDADGVTTQATATDAAHEDEAVRQTKKVTPHGSVRVEPASREIKRRIKFPALRAPGPIR